MVFNIVFNAFYLFIFIYFLRIILRCRNFFSKQWGVSYGTGWFTIFWNLGLDEANCQLLPHSKKNRISMSKTQQILHMPVNDKKIGYFCPHRGSRRESKRTFLEIWFFNFSISFMCIINFYWNVCLLLNSLHIL